MPGVLPNVMHQNRSVGGGHFTNDPLAHGEADTSDALAFIARGEGYVQALVGGVIEGNAASFGAHRRFTFLHDETKQLVLVIDRADEPVDLIEGFDLASEERRPPLLFRIDAHGQATILTEFVVFASNAGQVSIHRPGCRVGLHRR